MGCELVSIIIPCYRQARYLGQAICSALAQTYPHVEVIVVDDGSPDEAAEVASRYVGVRLIRQANRGVAAARNVGLLASGGEYVIFLDADDRLLERGVEVGVEASRSHPYCAFAWGMCRHIAADGSPVPFRQKPRIEANYYAELLRNNYIRTPATVIYRRWVFDEVGLFDESLHGPEDYDLNLRITRRFPVYCHGQTVAEYRIHTASACHDSTRMFAETLAALRSQWPYVRGHGEHEAAYREGWRAWCQLFGNRIMDELLLRRGLKVTARGLGLLFRYYPRGVAYRLCRELHRAMIG
ncbi:glycosyltransferase [Pyrinomonas methylaliphatogenes]|uniref:Glycosyl transferase n=1 Tax=Pyrinomonas methylaliphatogenes TaxID=454194 RepID=A0A0B6WY17_9BACT|nr:glycosyltransferase [Pyrinomonas methylaliphatogenes]CDM65184.1 glycosyl transferase [Pyrinomonas methylaliphatogenes]